jgi:hypothetical protein
MYEDAIKARRDDLARIRALEAALREIETFGSGSAVRVAREALGSTAETNCNQTGNPLAPNQPMAEQTLAGGSLSNIPSSQVETKGDSDAGRS